MMHPLLHREGRGDAAGPADLDPGLGRPLQEEIIEIGAPDLEAPPAPIDIAAVGVEAAGAIPLNPDALLARAGDGGQALGKAELGEQGLDAGMQGLAWPVPAGSLPLAQHDPASAIGAGDGRGGTRWAAAHH